MTSPLCTIGQVQYICSLKPTNNVEEDFMKRSHVPLKLDAEQPKALLRKLSFLEVQGKAKKRGYGEMKGVRRVTAGHVRGGHSFH